MKHITIVVPDGPNNISSIVGAYKVLTRANQYAQQTGKRALYTIELAGLSKEVEYFDGLFAVRPHKHISDIQKTDLVIIPSLNHNYEHAIGANRDIIDWLITRYKNGAEIASVCTGAFLLAEAGLLEGK
ncbi:MAG: DJ-1/PfpI family protein, partial [Mucilaginibacter sp.]